MSKQKSVFFSAILGNTLEYYDFTVYAVFSAIIGSTFFPNESQFIQDLSTLSVFAVGFATRPIGGILFGYIGDRYGRRIALIISMLGMTIPTFSMSFIPSYHEIGILAPMLLVLFRLMQGLCISGEGTGTAIFLLEHYKDLKPGFITGFVHGSNIMGTLIASGVGIIINTYFDITTAWRYAFIFGGCMGIVGFYLRLKVSETPIFRLMARKKQILKAPFSNVIRTSWRAMFITCCLGGVASSIVYLVKTYISVFYQNVMHFDNITSLMYFSYASCIMMIANPIAGCFSDIIGRFKTILFAAITVFIFSIPTFFFLSSEIFWQQILSLTALGILAGGMSGGAYIFIISLFPPEQRFTGVAFSYNLGIALFGGTSPIVARWLVESTGLFYAPAFYLMATSGLFLIAMYYMRKVVTGLIVE